MGGGPAGGSLWKVNYEYGELSQDGSSVDAAKNTGNIARQTLTVPGTSFVQSYRYDSLYRLTEAVEKTGTTQNWIQNWSYDRYGNRLTFTQNIAGNTNATNPTVDPNTNRFTSTDFGYDQNGNVVRDIDPLTSLSRTFVFNGDNKQTDVKDANGATIGRYFYDGEGKRVKKIVSDETTIFVYSSGKLIAEYSTQSEPNPAVHYTTTDHLGSPRVITDQFGQVTSRRDFLPFGEEIDASVGNRSNAGLQYTSGDSIRQKFTGYQKDNETSLDFAEARMYESRYGRFTAVDPLLASAKPENPQTLNRFVYVINRPQIMVDPTGTFGDFYDRNGHWIRSDGKNDKLVYLTERRIRPDGTDEWIDTLLSIKIKEFRTIANIIRQEGSSLDSQEYLWFAHTGNNEANHRGSTMSGLWGSRYSSVPAANKTELSDSDQSDRANFARAGLIDVLTGGKDPTGGARFFDGTDFLAWGLKSPNGTPHNKFEEYSEIVISGKIFNKFLNSQLSKYPRGSVLYRPNRYTIPAAVFTDPGNWQVQKSGWGPIHSTFRYTTGLRSRGTLLATGAWGQSIFWTVK